MKVFISWSGEKSRRLGEALRTWLPGVLQVVRPYFTPNDIEKGARWHGEIAKELDDSKLGILCMTPENLTSPWLVFEAGALSKKIDKSNVCPLLFDINNTELVGPLTQFQATSFTKEDVKKLVVTLNSLCGDQKLADNVLDQVFEMWWPRLEENVSSILNETMPSTDEPKRDQREILEEILELSRMMSSRNARSMDDRLVGHPAIEDLYDSYRELLLMTEIGDPVEIERCIHQFEKPIEYLIRRYRIGKRPSSKDFPRDRTKPPDGDSDK